MSAEVLLIDNYDSTWNLYQYLSLQKECGNITVVRSADVTLSQVLDSHPNITHLVISPGPGHPLTDSGISIHAIKHFAGKLPILGVCMGLQCMFAAYGGTVERVGEIVHGKTSVLKHDGKGIFRGVRDGINGTRYHSLAGTLGTLPKELEVTCRTPRLGQEGKTEEDGIVMGIRHKTLTMESVQYHPESILSDEGQHMLANFLNLRGGTWEENPGYGLSSEEVKQEQKSSDTSSAKAAGTASNSGSAPTILNRIYEQRRKDVEQAKATPGFYPSDLTAFLDLHLSPPQISFYDRLAPSTSSSSSSSSSQQSPVALMAEMKRASPSKGDILPPSSSLTSASIGLSYAQAGASVISVLTEPTWFKGTLNDMLSVRNVISHMPHRPAVLRKDFIFDTYQIDEARYYGADTVLLIVAMLSDEELKELYDYARYKRGMEPLVEVNNPEELERALKVGAKVIGVNNRNLHDFKVDMGTTSRIAEVIDQQSKDQQKQKQKANGQGNVDDRKVILCALSGIMGREDVVKYTEQGVGAILVGEALMRAEDKGAFVRRLLGTESTASLTATGKHKKDGSEPELDLTGPPDGLATKESFVTNKGLNGDTSPPQDQSAPSSSFTDFENPPYSPLVKICGIKTAEAALVAAEAGADFIGLIFAPKSKRYVSLEAGKEIVDAIRSRHLGKATAKLPAPTEGSATDPSRDFFSLQAEKLAKTSRKPLIVGVFQNQSFETVLQTLDTLNLDIVQLHGSEPSEWCRLLSVPTFKAFHVDEACAEEDIASTSGSATRLALREVTRPGYHSIPLLDTKISGSTVSGGAGKIFDWSIARKLVQEKEGGQPLVLAGGLDEGNVGNAVRMVRPWALDVSGGVETDGKKDMEKIRRFVKAAKGAV